MKAANFKLLMKILDDVEDGKITAAQAATKIDALNQKELDSAELANISRGSYSGGGGGCAY